MFERCFALSPRECELLEQAAAGHDTAALARRLGISRYTVQDIFKSLFGKCGVQSRGALLALAPGTADPGGPLIGASAAGEGREDVHDVAGGQLR